MRLAFLLAGLVLAAPSFVGSPRRIERGGGAPNRRGRRGRDPCSSLGHDPVLPDSGVGGVPPACDAILLEPAWARGATLVRNLPSEVPVVAASIYPPPTPVDLGVRAHLVKPLTLAQLDEAIATALAGG